MIFLGGGLLHISCMGWEVKIDKSGQSNGCLNGAHLRECMGYGAVVLTDLNFFHRICGTYKSNCCGHILANIN